MMGCVVLEGHWKGQTGQISTSRACMMHVVFYFNYLHSPLECEMAGFINTKIYVAFVVGLDQVWFGAIVLTIYEP